ncbi:hypothetical protein ISX56_29405 [Serratia ureilytica]|nr:hypothetical protein [Serratia ureilytica]
MIGHLLGVELNTHRQTLHHLDPVAGGVLGRQQREGAAGAHVDTDHFEMTF